ncbi:3-hydroxybutyryl-CoA dehydrogenase [Heyndrickxia ginsengihumi]|uniref:3-hydroxybutyryl-CoA dehydrogenase n=1 Tax=Heyndrickxia ginsengihumi TaxID=363870 RepID=A0A0A6VJC6_9BACI|nr:3-hydroxybutyryl-CoA dehydrogenase [Heyndrickxia ginsengihumi]KHD86719.1 3-hydroxybutyryl-CoA dehydrogenase [Heyndrickxia ginsengihumi]MBE6184720.1 3-hydroxybutyryl-CoA dehydrogenase [Bacillus sp. (in: firmicutes)]MCM3022186.1 3-hydroxybutyryl-CoA dehydrogenase [Heyndrickxia ginsengihumi]NEY18418.1 3-hydroxybutyryl-CoA dehydrogenase [Heyndrickxia ginsengihumi]
MTIKSVMVIGAGQMGSGIAQVFAQAGYKVLINDIKQELVEKSIERIKVRLFHQVDKNKLTKEQAASILLNFVPSIHVEDVEQADLVIEAATENMEIKKDIFKRIDQYAVKDAILASNTSSLSITEMAAVTKRPEQVIGMHFMNPVPVMKLVEMIRGLETSDFVYRTSMEVVQEIGKTPVEVKDFPGFISNRILMTMINEAIFALYEGIASKEAIDRVMTLGMNHPMGPLTLADFIGLDTCLYIMETLHEGFGDDKYRPCPLLKQYVHAGRLGKKTGRGFYCYE